MAAAILKFRNPAAGAEAAEAARVRSSCERLAADAAMLAKMADDYAGNPGNPFVSVALRQVSESLARQRLDLLAWAAARAEPRPEPRPGSRRGRRYSARPCGVPGCMARVRLDLGEDRCGLHAPAAARRREAAEARRARARLHATVTRMA